MKLSRKQQGELVDSCINSFHVKQRLTTTGYKKIDSNLQAYYNDARNESVLPGSIQAPVAITRGGVYFRGRVDQVREHNGELWVFDIKYSDRIPRELLALSLPQLLMYADALQVRVGGVINVKNYSRGDEWPVFHLVDLHGALHEYTNFLAREVIKQYER